MFDLIYWIFKGIVSTFAMSVLQIIQLGFYNKKTVPEFNQNAYLLSKSFKKSWDEIYWYGFVLHFAHGIFGAVFFGLLIESNILQIQILTGLLYAIILWVVLLLIHKPITGENIFKTLPNIQQISSLVSHLLYGLVLVIL